MTPQTERWICLGRLAVLALGLAGGASAQLVLPNVIVDATQGSYYYQTLTPSVGNIPYHSSLLDGSTLPQGVQFADTQYGAQFSGIPQESGQFLFTLEMSDSSTPPIMQIRQYRLTVHESGSHPFKFLTTTLPDAIYGAPYGPVILVTGGTYPYSGSYTGGDQGFGFDRNGSLISLGPLTTPPGTYHLTLQFEDATGLPQISNTFTVTVKAGIALNPFLWNGSVLAPYSSTVSVTGGGVAPYHFSVASGALPPGLTLNGPTGAISGTPSIPGTFNFNIGVTDSTGLTGSLDYSIVISGLALSMTPSGLPGGRVNVAYPVTQFVLQGGVAPYTLTLVGGSLPAGMSLSSSGILSGTPTDAGFFSADLRAVDQIGDVAQFVYPLTIQGVNPSTIPNAFVGSSFYFQFIPVGYSADCLLSVVSGSLPPGIFLTTQRNPTRFFVAGSPSEAGVFTFTVETQDPGGLPADRTYTVYVSMPTLSITKTHSGNFGLGQQGATYTVTVGSVGGVPLTSDVVTVTESLPPGLTLASLSGDGWSCSGPSCTRSGPLSSGSLFPPITVAVNVASNATSPQVNNVTASGGGSRSVSTTDSTTIVVLTRAAMSTPSPGSTLGGSSVTFSWNGVSGASAYWLDVGTAQGQGNLFASNVGLVTGQTVSGIPINGSTIYVRLWTQVSGNWNYNDYTYSAATGTSKAAISLPSPGSTLNGSSVTFTWTAGAGASAYWLDVGTIQGQGNIFGGNVGLSTSQSVSGIPTDGSAVYARLWTQTNGNWSYNSYTYTTASLTSKAVMNIPAPGSMLSGASVTFTWTAGAGASAYWLDVGSVQGRGDIFGANVALATSKNVTGVPTDGSTIYVRLWTQINGAWICNDYIFTAAIGTIKAVISSPSPGSTLSGPTVTFNWSAGAGASAYWLDVGTIQLQGNIFGSNVALATSKSVSGIPTDGSIIYVRLWTQMAGNWSFNDYTYRAATGASKAVITAPLPGSNLSGPSVTFSWAAGTGASAYWLDVGTIQGQGNIFGANVGLLTSQGVSGIPLGGVTVYVRLWTQLAGNWTFNDYSYTAGATTKAVMSTPSPGSTLSGSSVTFNWTVGVGASAYWLDVGTVQGQGNIFGSNVGVVTTQSVTGIPTNASTIYVRLWTQISGAWSYNDYTYTVL